MNNTLQKNVHAYVDESGAKGLIRNLKPAQDKKIAVIACIAVPDTELQRFYDAFREPFNRFKQARPARTASLHITDAFESGSVAWANVAREVREQIFRTIRAMQIPVVYHARRLRIVRQTFERIQNMIDQALTSRRSDIRVNTRPSAERVEEDCMIGLTLKLDALLTDYGYDLVDFVTDEMDRPIAKLFQSMMDHTRKMANPSGCMVRGFDPAKKERVESQFRIEVRDMLGQRIPDFNTRHIGNLVVQGKDHPLVFAADVTVNALWHHLSGLSSDAPLNHPDSIAGWTLGNRVYGTRPDALEDQI